MYQVALGGYYLASTSTTVLNDIPVYYEPGYNIMYPLEFEIPKCDIFYILIRKRSNSGAPVYETLTTSGISADIIDTTNGENISARLTTVLSNDVWDDDPTFTPIQLTVENNQIIGSVSARVVSIDAFISDNSDNTFIKFRSSVSDSGRFFYFMPLYTSRLGDRYKNTAVGTESYFFIDASSDSYLLFSPYSFFSEVDKGSEGISFSYPLGAIFYKRQKSYNDEDFDFSISSYSHSFIPENISLINIPGYRKVAALHVDVNMHSELSKISTNAFVVIESVGTLSGTTDTFRINLTR